MDLNKSILNWSNEIILDDSKEEAPSVWGEINESFLQDLALAEPFDPDTENTSKLRADEQYKGFDNNAGGQYIYPINLPIRTYQYNIIKASLFQNTLIVLPTGLGKTFIAAVVMYNIYRWYPTGKVIFMAPTRPLVSQQIDACCKIMAIPIEDTAEMTGKQIKNKRIELWHNKRIFFATPQVVQIDINDPEVNFPFDRIKLIVIDEAHKAKGRYAYTDVVQTINNRNPYFRIIALSATPGRRIEDVMEIIQNLCISHLEVRSENCIDVQPFTFKKNIKTVLVPLGEQLTRIRDELINIIDPYVRNLIDNGVLNGNTGNFTKFWLVMEQKRFKEMSINQRHPKHSVVSTDFSICISLYHALELLERHGLRVFLNFFDDADPKNEQEKFFVQSNPKLRSFLNNLRQEIGPNPFAISVQTMTNGKIENIPDNLDFGHPKFNMVKKFLVEHFQEHKESKVIVFCEFRESVMLLHRLLLQNRPLILPRIFVGQGGTGSIRAVSQKEQLQVMNDFRNGIVNTLIATSVAEEGIDVGEVNLIICFDISSKNPTRFVQRIGRTGRKQQGQVIMLATEGKEHSLVKEVLATRDKVNQKLSKSRAINHILYQRSPRIVPPEFNPKCLEVFMKAQNKAPIVENEKRIKNNKRIKKTETGNKKKCGRRKIEETGPPSQDVRNFFKKIELDNEDKEIFCSVKKKSNKIIPDNDLIEVDNLIKSISPEKPNTFSERSQVLSNVTSNIEINFRKLNHLSRKLDKTPNLPNYSNIAETIQSKTVDRNVKKFILQNNINFVREKFEAMQIISILNNNKIDGVSEIDNSEKQLQLIYSSIEEVLGDKYAIENFLKENTDKNLKKMNKIKKLDEKFSEFFEEFEERDFTDNVQGFIQEQLKEIDLNIFEQEQEQEKSKSVIKYNENASMVSENLLESETDASTTNSEYDLNLKNESKYADQWTQFDNEINNQSTPISKKLNKYNSKILVDSPFAISFQNGINRRSLMSIDESFAAENDTKQKDICTTVNYEKNISLSKNDDISKTDCPANEELRDHIINNENISAKLISNNLCKNDHISTDLFDDDFDEFFGSNAILDSIEKNFDKTKFIIPPIKTSATEVINIVSNTKAQTFMAPKFSPSREKPNMIKFKNESPIKNEKSTTEITVPKSDSYFIKQKLKSQSSENEKLNRFRDESPINSQNEITEHSMSMIEVDRILEIVAEKEKDEKAKHNTRNLDIEDFDLNDFLEPFEDESEWEGNYAETNTTPTKIKGKISRQLSDDIFNISSPNEKQHSKPTPQKENSPQESKDSVTLISPSLTGRRKPNFLQLKHITSKMNRPTTSKIKTDEMRISKSVNILDDPDFVNVNIQNKTAEESIILRPCRNMKNILESSESDEENDVCKLSQEIEITQTRSLQHWKERKKTRYKNRKNFKFFDDEAGHSGNDSSDDSDNNENDILDSIVVMDGEEEEDDPNVNMHAKYLQSIRSPKHLARGAFKIPPQRKFMDLSTIYSQPVKPDDTLKNCSFVVSDEENVFDGEVTEICPLEQAEAILKAKRKAKRKQKQFDIKYNKRRRIINNFIEISDDE